MKHNKVIFLMLLISLSQSSCDWRLVRDPDVLVQSIPADVPTLNPIFLADASSIEICSYIFESMLEQNRNTLEFGPKLAKRWEVSPDHLTYTFWLRDDVKWQDGKPFTADDVVFTFQTIIDPKSDTASLRNYFRDLEKIEKLDDYTVRFIYKDPYFKTLSTLGGVSIIPKHIFDTGEDINSHKANRDPVGTGPYRFENWKSGRSISLTHFENYWGEKPKITGVVYKVIPNMTSSFWMLKKGALDFATIRIVQWVKQTESRAFLDKFNKYSYYLPVSIAIGWNARKPFFSDRKVRQAMTMLINREAILKKALFGQGELIISDFYRFGPNYNTTIEPYPFDPQAAVKLLDGSGWIDHDGDGIRDKDGIPFRFSFLVPSGTLVGRSIGLFLTEELRKVGIEVVLSQNEWATFLKRIADKEFDSFFNATMSPVEGDPYQAWHSSQAKEGSNRVGFENKRADEIIERARREFDPKKRAVLYKELQEIIHEEEPSTFLFTIPTFIAIAKRFEDVEVYKLGVDSLKWSVGPWPVLIEW